MYIAVWIDIAQELRLLKNFSSLKAIVTGLNSSAIYRLSKIWGVLPKEKVSGKLYDLRELLRFGFNDC